MSRREFITLISGAALTRAPRPQVGTVKPQQSDIGGGIASGKLDVLRVECTNCERKGRYHVHRLIEKYRHQGNVMVWKEQLNGDCPKRDGRLNDRCDLVCPDLPKVL